MTKEKFSLKDHLFNRQKVEKIASEIQSVHSKFGKTDFVEEVLQEFPKLELKDRIHHISACLKMHLPDSYQQATEILLQSMPDACDPGLSDDDFGDFIYAPYSHFVAQYGCSQDHLQFSLYALEEITTRFSAEYAIRFFINAFPVETFDKLIEWTKHNHYHVRRLSSEGSRPKLPWSQKINYTPERAIPILDNLFADPTRFVTRSVANHLNDISKINPNLVVSTLKKWKKSGLQQDNELDFIIRHALRTLIKEGHTESLSLIGINHKSDVKISSFDLTKEVKMNTNLEFSFDLLADEITPVIVDFLIFFRNKKGELNSKKVFKLKKFTLEKGVSVTITKKHMLMQFMSTKTLYPGQHDFALQVNGKVLHRDSFTLHT
jgi:3-methyladenine DNA glycosylase AlkC